MKNPRTSAGDQWRFGRRDGIIATVRSGVPQHLGAGSQIVRFNAGWLVARWLREFKSNDHKICPSLFQRVDGKWTNTMTIDYRRRK